MSLIVGSRLGEGAFGDVYEGTDKLGRRVAVKIIRSAAREISSALDHARALARAHHPNVVSVYTIETLTDPETNEEAEGIVMEFLEGDTLGDVLRDRRLTLDELRTVGLGLIYGLRHLHEQGLVHGDLHVDNIILVGSTPKIIDILYRGSLAALTTGSREGRIQRDLTSTRMLLYDAILRSELNPANATDFNAALDGGASLDEMETALTSVLDPAHAQDATVLIRQAIARFVDNGYVDGDDYARALARDTPDAVCKPLIERVLELGVVGMKHRPYLRLLWDRLGNNTKNDLVIALEHKLENETPSGRWETPINLLAAFGRDCFERLSEVSRLRLESVMVNDLMAGRYDIYGHNIGHPGTLGTYVNVFWAYLHDRDRLVSNISALLRGSWYSQNYIGKYFMALLPLLGDTEERRARIVEGLTAAVANDAKLIVRGLSTLPPDWQQLVTVETDGDLVL